MSQKEIPLIPLTERRMERMREVAAQRLESLTIILDQVDDPHNISAVLRSCEVFGIHRVHIVHPEGPTIKLHKDITRHCDRWMELFHYSDIETCLNQVKKAGYLLYAADANPPSQELQTLDFSSPVALIVGAELYGLSQESKSAADVAFHIGMYGFTQSFNVSVAAALSLQSASQRRREYLGSVGDMNQKKQKELFDGWLADQQERRRRP